MTAMPDRESYSQGGYITPGPSTVRNNTGQPERILTGPEWDRERAAVNTDPPTVRCGMCGGRCRADATRGGFRARARWITCRSGCCWSSHDPHRVGLLWRLRVLIGR